MQFELMLRYLKNQPFILFEITNRLLTDILRFFLR